MDNCISSKHFNEEFESTLSDDRNVLHVHEQGISSLVLFAKYYDPRFVVHLQFEFRERKTCISSFTRRYSPRK